jgi:hypothetical protein
MRSSPERPPTSRSLRIARIALGSVAVGAALTGVFALLSAQGTPAFSEASIGIGNGGSLELSSLLQLFFVAAIQFGALAVAVVPLSRLQFVQCIEVIFVGGVALTLASFVLWYIASTLFYLGGLNV